MSAGREWALHPEALTPGGFARFGDVIGTHTEAPVAMNDERFQRFDRLAVLDFDAAADGAAAIGIARSNEATALPYRFDTLERHPLGSQAFVPLEPFVFVVVVARRGPPPAASDLRAYVTDGCQGVNYHRGVWHMPLIALEAGQRFLIADRVGGGSNVERHRLDETIMLLAPGPRR